MIPLLKSVMFSALGLQAAKQLVATLRVAESGLELAASVVDTAHEHALARRDLAQNAFYVCQLSTTFI